MNDCYVMKIVKYTSLSEIRNGFHEQSDIGLPFH